MSKKLYEETYISNIASAIRLKNGSSSTYRTEDMASAIISIPSWDPEEKLESLAVSENGSYVPTVGKDGFSNVVVSVPAISGLDYYKMALLCSDVTGIIVDSNITNLRPGAFHKRGTNVYYSNLHYVEMPNVLSIGQGAFCGDNKLSYISFLKCEYIGQAAFDNCNLLPEASFPVCSYIGNYAFQYCTSLTSISFPVCSYMGSSAFENCSSLTEVSFPVCSYIGDDVFRNCTSLTEASFPVCSYIGAYAFYNCASLALISFPVCSYIAGDAFHYCSSLTEASFPLCNYISLNAFVNCTSLTEASFPVCSYIASNVFQNCTSLSGIYLLSTSVVYLHNTTVFKNTPISVSTYLGYFGSIFVLESLVSAYKTAKNWSAYSSRIAAYIE